MSLFSKAVQTFSEAASAGDGIAAGVGKKVYREGKRVEELPWSEHASRIDEFKASIVGKSRKEIDEILDGGRGDFIEGIDGDLPHGGIAFYMPPLAPGKPALLQISLPRARADYDSGLAYWKGLGEGQSAQKAEVLRRSGVDPDEMHAWFEANGGFDDYMRFITDHERGHAYLEHSAGHAHDVMKEADILIEVEANDIAFAAQNMPFGGNGSKATGAALQGNPAEVASASIAPRQVNTAGLRSDRAAVIEMNGNGYKDMPNRNTAPIPQTPAAGAVRSAPTPAPMSVPPQVSRDHYASGNNPFWKDDYMSRQIK